MLGVLNSENSKDIFVFAISQVVRLEEKKLLSPHYLAQVRQYEQENSNIGNKKVLFIGDSYIAKFDLKKYTISSGTVNYGINGDTTVGLLSRIPKNVNNVTFKHVYFMIGYNDLKYRNTSRIIENYRKIIEEMQADRLTVFSLLPVHKNRFWTNSRVSALNEQLSTMAKQANIDFVNLYPHFLDSSGRGILDEYTADGTHLSEAGYRKFAFLLQQDGQKW